MSDQNLTPVPPHSLEAENAVIGCMLIDREALESSLEQLGEDSFYDPNIVKVFAAIKRVFIDGSVVDIITLADELKKSEAFESVGGAEFLTHAINFVSTAAHINDYIRIVKEKHVLRNLLKSCQMITAECLNNQDAPSEILERAERYIYQAADRTVTSNLEDAYIGIHETIEMIEKMHERKDGISGVESGFKSLDMFTAGFQPGNLIIIAARPGMGKSALAVDIIRHNVIKKKKAVAFFSLEMTRPEIFMRMMSASSHVPLYQIRHGFTKGESWTAVMKSAEAIAEAPIYMDCTSAAMSALNIRSAARRLASSLARKKQRLGMIVVDYIQLLSSPGKWNDNRQTEVAAISRGLKILAIDLNIPVIALSQLNRETEQAGRNGRPRLSDLRESGAIEQDSDLVMFIYREGLYKTASTDEEKAKTKLLIAKHRNGGLGEIDLFFRKEITSFAEITKQDSSS